MDEDLLNLWLGTCPNVSNLVMGKILDFFGGAEELWNADEKDIKENLTENQSRELLKFRDISKLNEYKNRLKERDITYIYPGHKYFPKNLTEIPDCPRLLYARGKVSELNNGRTGIAIVGARKASIYGRKTAGEFAGELSYCNTTIISGMALGIDSEAHKATLENPDGFTAAVLGCGINVCYPRENYELYEQIKMRGVILSEYGLDVIPESWRFPYRNRIISGLAKGVIVVEARERSGSLITADQALEQGRDVYAVPGRISDVNSRGCNNLIKQGALCVTSPSDVINDMGLHSENAESCYNFEEKIKDLSDDEKKVYAAIGENATHIESICIKSGLKAYEVLGILFDLEKNKIIKQSDKGYFIRCTG